MNPKEELKALFANRNDVEVAIEIHGFTGFRTTLLDELTEDEAIKLLALHTPTEQSIEEEFDALKETLLKREWKHKILFLAEKLKIKDNGFQKFNDWMLTRSLFKKHLNAHSLTELKQLHAQLHAVRTNNAKSAKKPMTKAWWEKGKEKINLN